VNRKSNVKAAGGRPHPAKLCETGRQERHSERERKTREKKSNISRCKIHEEQAWHRYTIYRLIGGSFKLCLFSG